MQTLSIKSRQRAEFVDITGELRAWLKQKTIQQGALLVFCPHTTAGITINEGADPDVKRDLLTTLARLVPEHGDYHHAEGNSDAHLKASLMGSSAVIPIFNGELLLGTWQSVYFCEFDGPRNRHVHLTLLPG